MTTSRYQRDRLPAPQSFYQAEIGKLSRPNSKQWAQARCPFHPSQSGTSFSVNLRTGAFVCFGCGVKGGDITAFLMKRDQIDFVTAAKKLGAWRDGALSEHERYEIDRAAHRRERVRQAAAELAEQEHNLRMEYRDWVHRLEQMIGVMRGRLQSTSPESDDYQDAGRVLRLALDELREALAAYYLLSFGMTAAKIDFIQNPETRDRTIAAVLGQGVVRDDDGHTMEITL